MNADRLLGAVRTALEAWPKAFSLSDVLLQLSGQLSTFGMVGMEPATVLDCLGVVMVPPAIALLNTRSVRPA